MHAEDGKTLLCSLRSHEDADMQDVEQTNSGKHYERTRMMLHQEMQERQILPSISKGPKHYHCKHTGKDSRPEPASRQGSKDTAHHHRHSQPSKVQHDLPSITEAHKLVPKRKRKITTHQPPVPSEASGANILKESLKIKTPKHTSKSSPYPPFHKCLCLWLDL